MIVKYEDGVLSVGFGVDVVTFRPRDLDFESRKALTAAVADIKG